MRWAWFTNLLSGHEEDEGQGKWQARYEKSDEDNDKLRQELDQEKEKVGRRDEKIAELKEQIKDLEETRTNKRLEEVEQLLFDRNQENYKLDAQLGRIGRLAASLQEKWRRGDDVHKLIDDIHRECGHYAKYCDEVLFTKRIDITASKLDEWVTDPIVGRRRHDEDDE